MIVEFAAVVHTYDVRMKQPGGQVGLAVEPVPILFVGVRAAGRTLSAS
jgi:hypothetical protein